MKKYKFDKELLNSIREDSLIIFAGAGVSYNLTNSNDQLLEGWNNLVIQLLQSLDTEGYSINHLKELGLKQIYEPIVILDLIEKDIEISRVH